MAELVQDSLFGMQEKESDTSWLSSTLPNRHDHAISDTDTSTCYTSKLTVPNGIMTHMRPSSDMAVRSGENTKS